jgi:alpha-beta hydrolase superfamily lysophospholipase
MLLALPAWGGMPSSAGHAALTLVAHPTHPSPSPFQTEDFLLYVDTVVPTLPSPCPPLFLLGHSMGGLVVALACAQRPRMWAGMMMHSPAVDVEWTPVLRWVRAPSWWGRPGNLDFCACATVDAARDPHWQNTRCVREPSHSWRRRGRG